MGEDIFVFYWNKGLKFYNDCFFCDDVIVFKFLLGMIVEIEVYMSFGGFEFFVK